jgi:hypothetical protein
MSDRINVNTFPVGSSSVVMTSNVGDDESIIIGKILEKLITRAPIEETLVLLLDFYGINNQDDNRNRF